jgi:F0F1-type ATP synthase gamma subunit
LDNHKEWDNIWLLYNEYVNTISFNLKTLKIMSRKEFKKRFFNITAYEIEEPDYDISMDYFYELYVAS